MNFVLHKGFVFQQEHPVFVLFINLEDAVPAKGLGGDIVVSFRAEQGAVQRQFPDAAGGLLNLLGRQVFDVARQFQKTQDTADIVPRVSQEKDISGLRKQGGQLVHIENQVRFFDNFSGKQIAVAVEVPLQRQFFLEQFDFKGSGGSPEQIDGSLLAGCDGQQRGDGGRAGFVVAADENGVRMQSGSEISNTDGGPGFYFVQNPIELLPDFYGQSAQQFHIPF